MVRMGIASRLEASDPVVPHPRAAAAQGRAGTRFEAQKHCLTAASARVFGPGGVCPLFGSREEGAHLSVEYWLCPAVQKGDCDACLPTSGRRRGSPDLPRTTSGSPGWRVPRPPFWHASLPTGGLVCKLRAFSGPASTRLAPAVAPAAALAPAHSAAILPAPPLLLHSALGGAPIVFGLSSARGRAPRATSRSALLRTNSSRSPRTPLL